MRRFVLTFLGFVLTGFLILGMECQQLLDEALEVEVDVEERLFSGPVSGGIQTIPIVTGLELTKGAAFVGKPAGFAETSFPVADVGALVAAFEGGGGAFTGTVRNNGSDPVTLGIYFSATSGLTDPETQASFIASLVLPAAGVTVLDGLDDFDQGGSTVAANVAAFFRAHPHLTTVYVYLTAEDGSTVDVMVETLSVVLGAVAHERYVFQSDSLNQYADSVQEIQDGYISGTVTNNGEGPVTIRVFVGRVCGGSPPAADLVLQETVGPGQTVTIRTENSQQVEESIQRLIDGEDVECNFFAMSPNAIDVMVSALDLRGRVLVSL